MLVAKCLGNAKWEQLLAVNNISAGDLPTSHNHGCLLQGLGLFRQRQRKATLMGIVLKPWLTGMADREGMQGLRVDGHSLCFLDKVLCKWVCICKELLGHKTDSLLLSNSCMFGFAIR